MATNGSHSDSCCFVCNDIVHDQHDFSGSAGDKGLFCDGFHKQWVHASCLNSVSTLAKSSNV